MPTLHLNTEHQAMEQLKYESNEQVGYPLPANNNIDNINNSPRPNEINCLPKSKIFRRNGSIVNRNKNKSGNIENIITRPQRFSIEDENTERVTERYHSAPKNATPFQPSLTQIQSVQDNSSQYPLEISKSEENPRQFQKSRSNIEFSGPFYGSKSEQGSRMYQEDRHVEKPGLYSIQQCLCAPKQIIPDGLQQYSALQQQPSIDNFQDPRQISENISETHQFHYFAVFDGHGGDQTSTFCQDNMAQILEKRLQENLDTVCSISSVELAENNLQENVKELEFMANHNDSNNSNNSNNSSIVAADLVNVDNDDSMDVTDLKNVSNCRQYQKSQSNKTSSSDSDVSDCIDGVETALREAFVETDKLFQQQDFENHDVIGSTALVMLVSPNSIYVGNVGDSRAVLCRNGEALPLSDDHKADRLDEMKRVKDLGGHILHWNGVRVMGILAMSRAIGDAQLKPYIIPDPEVTVVHRKKSDQIVIMASDGLWDVFDNQEACVLALRCLYRARQRGATRRAATRIAAAILAKAAIDRGSRDNVTVLVVDLKSKDTDFTKEEVQDAVQRYKVKKQQEDNNIIKTNEEGGNNDEDNLDKINTTHTPMEEDHQGEKIPPSPFVTPATTTAQNQI